VLEICCKQRRTFQGRIKMEVIFFLLLSITASVSGQQLTFKNCFAYKPINASNYDMNPSSQNPLGYYSNVLPYSDGNKVTPCVEVSGIPSTAYVEIKVETRLAGTKICVGDEQTLRACGQGSLSKCTLSPSTVVKFAFYCDSACEQVDVPFWYRFVISGNNPSDQWCEGRPSDDFPSSLISPPTHLPTASTPRDANGASHGSFSLLSLLAVLLISILFLSN